MVSEVGFRQNDDLPSEQRYAQVEKEALAVTWACEKFADYVIGMRISLNTDHKPLVPLLGSMNLDQLIKPPPEEERRKEEVRAYVSSIIRYLPATDDRLKELRDQLQQDAVTRQIMTYCTDGWPDKSKLDGAVKPYWTVSGELTVQQGLLMKGSRLVIPISMRLDILDRLHEGHQGITRCREKDKTSVWWPGLSKQLEELVRS